MSPGTFSDRMIRLEAFKRIFLFRPKINFFRRISPGFLVRTDQIFKSGFSTCSCP